MQGSRPAETDHWTKCIEHHPRTPWEYTGFALFFFLIAISILGSSNQILNWLCIGLTFAAFATYFVVLFIWKFTRGDASLNKYLVLIVSYFVFVVVVFSLGYFHAGKLGYTILESQQQACPNNLLLGLFIFQHNHCNDIGLWRFHPSHNNGLVKALSMLEAGFGPLLLIAVITLKAK